MLVFGRSSFLLIGDSHHVVGCKTNDTHDVFPDPNGTAGKLAGRYAGANCLKSQEASLRHITDHQSRLIHVRCKKDFLLSGLAGMVRDHVAQIVDFIWASNALKFRCDILANFFLPTGSAAAFA